MPRWLVTMASSFLQWMRNEADTVLERWHELSSQIKQLSKSYGLELLAMEQPSQDPVKMELAYQAAVELGIPVINCSQNAGR